MIFVYIPHTYFALSPLCSRERAKYVCSFLLFFLTVLSVLFWRPTASSLQRRPNISFAKPSINSSFHSHLPKIVSKYWTYYIIIVSLSLLLSSLQAEMTGDHVLCMFLLFMPIPYLRLNEYGIWTQGRHLTLIGKYFNIKILHIAKMFIQIFFRFSFWL